MLPQTQQDPMTQYLMFKLAIGSGDQDLASQCLEGVCNASGHDLLYACILDSCRLDAKPCAVRSLKKLIAQYDLKASAAVHQPALLRCTVRLLYILLEEETSREEQRAITRDLCEVFDQSKSSPSGLYASS